MYDILQYLLACAERVTVVGPVCVCVPYQQLTSGASLRPENDIMYSTGNEGQIFLGISLKSLHCRDTPLPAL